MHVEQVGLVGRDGVLGYAAVPWYTISVASGVPSEIVDTLNAAINQVLVLGDFAPRWRELGVTPLGGSPQDAQRRNEIETRRWSEVIATARIKAE